MNLRESEHMRLRGWRYDYGVVLIKGEIM